MSVVICQTLYYLYFISYYMQGKVQICFGKFSVNAPETGRRNVILFLMCQIRLTRFDKLMKIHDRKPIYQSISMNYYFLKSRHSKRKFPV